MSDAPEKIWLEYSEWEQHLHITDELAWTGYLTEYVRADTLQVVTDNSKVNAELIAKNERLMTLADELRAKVVELQVALKEKAGGDNAG